MFASLHGELMLDGPRLAGVAPSSAPAGEDEGRPLGVAGDVWRRAAFLQRRQLGCRVRTKGAARSSRTGRIGRQAARRASWASGTNALCAACASAIGPRAPVIVLAPARRRATSTSWARATRGLRDASDIVLPDELASRADRQDEQQAGRGLGSRKSRVAPLY